MILLADIGNTHTVFGLSSGRKILGSWRFSTGRYETEDELYTHLHPLLEREGITLDSVEEFVVASVVPSVNECMERFARKYLKNGVIWVKASNVLPVKWDIVSLDQLGADRVANVLAAWEEHGNNAIIVDFGTAITIDVLFQGTFRGGAILPGFMTSIYGLFRNTAKLPMVDLKFPRSPVGRDTDENLRVGIVLGTVRAIDGLIEDIFSFFGTDDMRVICTGGQAPLAMEGSRFLSFYDPYLTLKGMVVYFELVRKS